MICNQENMTHNEEKYQLVEIDAKLLLKIADNVIKIILIVFFFHLFKKLSRELEDI